MECRGVDTFSRLANSSAASAPTPAPCSTRRDCREALLAETIVPPIATPRHAHSSRAAAHASPRRTGSAFPVHRRDGLGQCERVRVGCPLRSSKRGYRVCVVRGGAIATYVGDKKNAQKTLTVATCRLSWCARVVSESPSGYSDRHSVWTVRRVRRSVSRVPGERRALPTESLQISGLQKSSGPCKVGVRERAPLHARLPSHSLARASIFLGLLLHYRPSAHSTAAG